MPAKHQYEAQAQKAVNELQHLAIRLRRAHPNTQAELLKRADDCLRTYKMAKGHIHEEFGEEFSTAVAPGIEDAMQSLAAVISDVLESRAFCLLVFSDDLTSYVSNCVRDDMVAAMREFIAKHEAELDAAGS